MTNQLDMFPALNRTLTRDEARAGFATLKADVDSMEFATDTRALCRVQNMVWTRHVWGINGCTRCGKEFPNSKPKQPCTSN